MRLTPLSALFLLLTLALGAQANPPAAAIAKPCPDKSPFAKKMYPPKPSKLGADQSVSLSPGESARHEGALFTYLGMEEDLRCHTDAGNGECNVDGAVTVRVMAGKKELCLTISNHPDDPKINHPFFRVGRNWFELAEVAEGGSPAKFRLFKK